MVEGRILKEHTVSKRHETVPYEVLPDIWTYGQTDFPSLEIDTLDSILVRRILGEEYGRQSYE